MTDYTYFPGCSLSASAKNYDISTRAVAKEFGINLIELEDWNCCGATAYMSVNESMSFSISARNLAIAEKYHRDLVTPCSACYTVLRKTDKYIESNGDLKPKIDEILAAAKLNYTGSIEVRHILDVFVNDVGLKKIKEKILQPLTGLKVAPHYGCQIVRPYGYENPENPVSLDNLIIAMGATAVNFPLKTKCCGGALMATRKNLALKLVKNLLECAKENGAECIATTCPLCQINIDAFQSQVNSIYNTNFKIPILFFTQLLGSTLKIEHLGIKRSITSAEQILTRYS